MWLLCISQAYGGAYGAPAAGGYGAAAGGYGGGYGAPGAVDPYASAAAGYGAAAGGYSAPVAAPAAAATSSVWQELQDDQGRTYYYNGQTGVSQWEKPADM